MQALVPHFMYNTYIVHYLPYARAVQSGECSTVVFGSLVWRYTICRKRNGELVSCAIEVSVIIGVENEMDLIFEKSKK